MTAKKYVWVTSGGFLKIYANKKIGIKDLTFLGFELLDDKVIDSIPFYDEISKVTLYLTRREIQRG